MTTRTYKRSDYPANKRLTEEERDRMIDMLAEGPLKRQPVDEGLIRKNWLQVYEFFGDPTDTSVLEATEAAGRVFYLPNGRVNPHWYPRKN